MVHMGMPPKGARKTTSTGSSPDTVEQATILTATINIQELKIEFLVLEGVALLVASCQAKNDLPLYTWAPPWVYVILT